MTNSSTRRRFLKQAVTAGSALALAPGAAAGAPERSTYIPRRRAHPVRVRGRVQAGGRGLAGVAVTDGRSVAETDSDGRFDFVAGVDRSFVYLSLPSGYRIPQNDVGTARFYEPILPHAGGEMQVSFDLAPLAASDEQHAFFGLADPQTRDAAEMVRLHSETVPDVRQAARNLQVPAFGVSIGDIMYDDLSLFPEYERAVSKMELPFFQVVGNHDLDYDGWTDEASTPTFQQYFGPTYYSFDRGQVHYVVLDDVFWNHVGYFGYLGADQLRWLEVDLARVEAGRPVVIFMHIPSLSTRYERVGEKEPHLRRAVTNRAALYALLEPYQAHIISGHLHENEHLFHGRVHEQLCGTVCGTWWSGPICHDGTPNGYVIYEIDDEDIRWRYKSTGYDIDHQLRVYQSGTDEATTGELVANVWNWDPEWRVFWYEDGARRGEMRQRTGIDPLAAQLRDNPKPTNHLFVATVSPDAGRLQVEAVDRWGRSYTAAPERL